MRHFWLAHFEQIRQQGVQAVDSDKFLGEVERRPEMIGTGIVIVDIFYATVRVGGAGANDAGTGGENGVQSCRHLGIFRFAHLRDDYRQRFFDARVVKEQALPIRIHGSAERLIVEQLCCPLDRMDLGNLGSDDEPRNFEQFVVADVLIADHSVWTIRVSQSRIRIGIFGCFLTERIDKNIVLTHKQIVIETQADRPIFGEGNGFLTGPFGVYGIGNTVRSAALTVFEDR